MNTDLARYYRQRAREYERIYEKPERQADLAKLRDLCGQFAGLDVLEVSCGTGYWTQHLALAAKSVLACDINEEVLEIACGKRWKGTSPEFVIADSYALPAFGRLFTGGFSGFWWSHIPKEKLDTFLRGFHGELPPGALVMFFDNRYVEGSSTPISRVDEDGNTFQERGLSDGSRYEVLKNFPSPEELGAAVEGMGREIEVRVLEYYWVLSYRTAKQVRSSK